MVTARALWEVNQIWQGFFQFKPNFFLSTWKSKMENAPDIKSKSLKPISMIDPEIYIDFLKSRF